MSLTTSAPSADAAGHAAFARPATRLPRSGTLPAQLAEAYVVSTHKVRDRSAGVPLVWQPYGVQHAWLAGSRRTLCGQVMSGWTVFWERRFSPSLPTACHECVEASLPAASRSRLDPRSA